MSEEQSEALVTPRDLVRQYRIKYSPLLKAIDEGRIPHIRIGRTRYIMPSKFRAFLERESANKKST